MSTLNITLAYICFALEIVNWVIFLMISYQIIHFMITYKRKVDMTSMKCLLLIIIGSWLESVDITSAIDEFLPIDNYIGLILLFIYYVGQALHQYGLIHYIFVVNDSVCSNPILTPLFINPKLRPKIFWQLYYMTFIIVCIEIFILHATSKSTGNRPIDIVYLVYNQLVNIHQTVFQYIAFIQFRQRNKISKNPFLHTISHLQAAIIVIGSTNTAAYIIFDIIALSTTDPSIVNISDLWALVWVLTANAAGAVFIYLLTKKVADFLRDMQKIAAGLGVQKWTG